jgi:hypothetical protein
MHVVTLPVVSSSYDDVLRNIQVSSWWSYGLEPDFEGMLGWTEAPNDQVDNILYLAICMDPSLLKSPNQQQAMVWRNILHVCGKIQVFQLIGHS